MILISTKMNLLISKSEPHVQNIKHLVTYISQVNTISSPFVIFPSPGLYIYMIMHRVENFSFHKCPMIFLARHYSLSIL